MARWLLLSISALLASAPLAAQTVRLVAPAGSDAGDCSAAPCATLTYAIGRSSAGDVLSVAAGTYTEAGIVLDRDLTLRGAGRDLSIVQGAAVPRMAPARIFTVAPGVTAVLEDVTLRHGRDVAQGAGGGLHNRGTVTLRRVAVLDNYVPNPLTGESPRGGGLYNLGTMRLEHVLVRGNAADRDVEYGSSVGGGVYNHGVTGAELLEVFDSVIEGNDADVSGGIENMDYDCYCDGPRLHIERSTIVGNTAVRAGGIRNGLGDVTVVSSTVSGNVATGLWGGGIESLGGSLDLSHTTVTGNRAYLHGGGVESVSFSLRNTLIAGNVAPASADCHTHTSAALSHDHNLIGDGEGCHLTGATAHTLVGVVPLLGPLADNGGPTPTHALLAGSPAIDAGTCEGAGGEPVGLDQRGLLRPAPCDIGAFEADAGVATGTSEGPASPDRLVLAASANPFHDAVTVELATAEPGRIVVALYDALGRRLAVLFDGTLAAGSVWRIDVDGRALAPGTYVVAAEGGRSPARLLLTRTR